MTYSEILARIHQLGASITGPDETEISHLEHRRRQYEKWQLLHEYVRQRPFRVDPRLPRSRQWHEAMNRVRELRDRDVIDWLWTQAEISRHHEQGIQDIRPPMKGTCHEALLVYLCMREHKALVVLKWEESAQADGCYRVDSAFHARTAEILARHRKDHDDTPPFSLDDPWLRS